MSDLITIIHILFLLFGLDEGFLFTVSRGGQGDAGDKFSNMNYSETCSKASDDGRSWCVARGSDCSKQGCCTCVCSYASSTFRMDSSLDTAKCVENSYMRNFAGCSTLFEGVTKSHPLVRLDLEVKGSKGISNVTNHRNCSIENALYLNKRNWKRLGSREKNAFAIVKIKGWPYTKLQWNGNMTASYFGYIMKLEVSCSNGPSNSRGGNFCLVFKAKGNRTWFISESTTTPTKTPSILNVSTKDLSSTAVISVTKTERAVVTTGQTAPATDHLTGTTEVINRETTTKSKPGQKVISAIVAGSATVFCLLVVFFIWLILNQRKKNRFSVNNIGGTTVIANPAIDSPGTLQTPGLLKNPAFDDSNFTKQDETSKSSSQSVYANVSNDPAVEGMLIANPAGMGGLGWATNSSPVKPIGARCMKNNKEWTNETQRDGDTLVFHNKGCFVKAVERSNGHDTKSLPNESFYQSLNRDKMIYQPLRKNEVPKDRQVIPLHGELIGTSGGPGIVPSSPPEYQPPYTTGPPPADVVENPEYADYADLDELEEIAGTKSSKNSLNKEPYNIASADGKPKGHRWDYSNPVYASSSTQELEPPVYAVLECPDTSP